MLAQRPTDASAIATVVLLLVLIKTVIILEITAKRA